MKAITNLAFEIITNVSANIPVKKLNLVVPM